MDSIVSIITCASIYLLTMLTIVQVKKDNTIGNFTWGGLVMLIALTTFFFYAIFLPRQILGTILIMLWGLRLAYYTYARYQKGADPRFVAWQKQWGKYALFISIGWICGLNGFMGTLMALPIIVINSVPGPALTWFDAIAFCVWIIGFLCESISDYQLYIFRKNIGNRDTVLQTGLWRYSRHPNYFGEIVMWWALYALALPVHYGWLTIVSPLAVTTTLLFVTGIPWIERAMAYNPAYQEYKKHTSMLVPWFRL